MKHSRIFAITCFFVTGCISVIALSGCKSGGYGQPANPFAMDRQTAPPPATFSHQTSYLGQQPGAVYTPQAPATTYPVGTVPSAVPAPASIPATIPSSAPLPTGTGVPAATTPSGGGYGSIGGSTGAMLFHATETNAAPSSSVGTLNGWTATEASAATVSEIPSSYTRETAFQNMETQKGFVTQTSAEGIVSNTVTAPENLVVSSSQTITQVGADPTLPEPALAEPKTMYAGQYQ